ncbi:MAG: hypothetical protein ACPG7F_16845, partial [Aggregatilineales bacterium]
MTTIIGIICGIYFTGLGLMMIFSPPAYMQFENFMIGLRNDIFDQNELTRERYSDESIHKLKKNGM